MLCCCWFFFCLFVLFKSALHYITIYACYVQNTYLYFFNVNFIFSPVSGESFIKKSFFLFITEFLKFHIIRSSNYSLRYLVICPIHVLVTVTCMCWWWIYGGRKLAEWARCSETWASELRRKKAKTDWRVRGENLRA